MKLISLKLLHFRRFRQEEIFFEEDFCLLFGKNGAGKSSILDAIGYALFGPSSKDFVRLNTTFLRSYFLTGREPSKVELVFQYHTETYQVVRVIDAGIKKFESDFILENKDTLTGPSGLSIIGGSEVSHYIQNLLGVSREVFLRSVFTKQKDLEVLSGTKEERKKLIHTILGIDAIENAIGELKKVPRENKIKIEQIQNELEGFDEGNLKDQEKSLTLAQDEQRKKLQDSTHEYEGFQRSFEEKQKLQKIMQEKKSTFFKLNGIQGVNVKLTEATLKQQKDILGDLEKIASLKDSILKEKGVVQEEEKLRGELEIQKQKLQAFQELQKTKATLIQEQHKCKILDEKIQALQSQKLSTTIQEFEDKQEGKKKLHQEKIALTSALKSSRDTVLREGESLKKELEAIEKLGTSGECPTCHQSLEKHLPILIEGYTKRLDDKRREYRETDSKYQESHKDTLEYERILLQDESDLKRLRESQKNLELFCVDQKNLSSLIHELETKIKDSQSLDYDPETHQKLQNEYLQVRQRLGSYQEKLGIVKQEDALKQKIKELDEKLVSLSLEQSTISQQILEVGYSENEYTQVQKSFEDAQKRVMESQKDLQIHKETLLHTQYALKKNQETQLMIQQKIKQIKTLQEEILLQETYTKILGDYIVYLLASLKPQLEDMASEYFSLITNGKYTQINLDEDYNLMIDAKNIELYSGGEKDLANVCLRLALGQNLTSGKGNPIHFLILDEILGSQDKQRQYQILVNLKQLEKKFSQIILISHDEDIKDLASHLIEVKSISNDESTVIIHQN